MNRLVTFLTAFFLSAFSLQLMAQAPSWTQPVQYANPMGGDSGREAPAATVFPTASQSDIMMVYTSRTSSGNGNYYLESATSSDGLHYSSPSEVLVGGVPATALSNPALTVYNGFMYLAYNNTNGTQLLKSADGLSWFFVEQLPTGVPVNYSPSLAVLNSVLMIGLKQNVSSGVAGLVLCTYTTTAGATCSLNSSTGLNYGPNLLVYGTTLLINFAYQGNSHTLLYYTYFSGSGIDGPAQQVTGATTSAAPGSADDGEGTPYLAYRANDGGNGLYTVRLLENGDQIEWGTNYYSGYGIGGPPMMFGNVPNYVGKLFVLYAANDSSHFMYATSAQAN
jgi:hypothetical protein